MRKWAAQTTTSTRALRRATRPTRELFRSARAASRASELFFSQLMVIFFHRAPLLDQSDRNLEIGELVDLAHGDFQTLAVEVSKSLKLASRHPEQTAQRLDAERLPTARAC